MDHKHLKTIVARVFLVTCVAVICCTSYAMESPHSLPTTKHLTKLLQLHRKSTDCHELDFHDIEIHHEPDYQDIEIRAEIVSFITSPKKNLVDLIVQTKYSKHIQEELKYWLSLACSKKAHKKAALLCARYERSLQRPDWELLRDHAFNKAHEDGILIEFACSLAQYQKALILEIELEKNKLKQ